MKNSSTIKEKIFNDKNFYTQKALNKRISTADYESKNGNKDRIDMRTKRDTVFIDHTYSSLWNPLSSKLKRNDKQYRQTYEHKKSVKNYSNLKSDPFSIQPSAKMVKKQTKKSQITLIPTKQYKVQMQRKYYLPQDRVTRPKKTYHNQLGISLQKIQQLQIHNNTNSSNMRLSLSSTHLNLLSHH